MKAFVGKWEPGPKPPISWKLRNGAKGALPPQVLWLGQAHCWSGSVLQRAGYAEHPQSTITFGSHSDWDPPAFGCKETSKKPFVSVTWCPMSEGPGWYQQKVH